MSILMMLNLKGGVAKTTSAVAVAECLASQGFRTLLIDADHQCMAGELLLGECRLLQCEKKGRTLHDLLASMLDDEFRSDQFEGTVTRRVSNIGGGLTKLAVLPCSIRIDDFSTNMAKARRGHSSNDEFLGMWNRRRQLMKRWVEENFDFAVIDCPPSLALQVRFLLSVADDVIVPTLPDRLSIRGSLFLLDRLRSHGYKVVTLGTLWSMVRARTVHDKFIEATRRGVDPLNRLPVPFQTAIPNATKIAESADIETQKPRTFYQKYGEFAKLFESLCEEIVQKTQWRRTSQQPKQPEAIAV
ncbi:MAG: AAA family ATPase [Gemmataceae bacterium]